MEPTFDDDVTAYFFFARRDTTHEDHVRTIEAATGS